MYPANFEYHRPASLDEAVKLMGQLGDDCRVLAGGHSLVPMMKLRLAQPAHLVDINGIAEIKGVRDANGTIVIGAATTQAEALASAALSKSCPLIAETLLQVADPQVRYCGTIGGNVANGDPGNDLPAVMMALGASFALRGPKGEREVAAVDFYKGTYDTAREDNEILTEIRIPAPAKGHGWSYRKLKRKTGDFATAAAAVVLSVKGGKCESAAIALTNVGDAAINATDAAQALVGGTLDDGAIDKAAQAAMKATDPVEDMHGPVEYRRQMAGEMTRRAIREAASRAKGG